MLACSMAIRVSCMTSSCELLVPLKACRRYFIVRSCWLSLASSTMGFLAFDFRWYSFFVCTTSSKNYSRGMLEDLHIWDQAESTLRIDGGRDRCSYISLGALVSPFLPPRVVYHFKQYLFWPYNICMGSNAWHLLLCIEVGAGSASMEHLDAWHVIYVWHIRLGWILDQ